LNRFDVVSSETAEDALTSVFDTRPELFKAVTFDRKSLSFVQSLADKTEDFWTNLTPERAFLARVFVEYCVKNKDETRMEDTMPVVAELAFRIQEEYNKLEETFTSEEEGDEEENAERSFIVGELMRLAVNMDYTDQYGRSAMFQHASESLHSPCRLDAYLQGEMISQQNLPPPLIHKCMDILCKIANSERDLIRIVVDVVSELREGQGDEEIDAVSNPQPSWTVTYLPSAYTK
jgi:condensin complex subunit 3